MLHRHGSRRRRVVQRAVHRLAPSGNEPHGARERSHTRYRGRREDGDSVLLEEAFASRSRAVAAVALRTRGVLPAQSRRNEVGVGVGGIRSGEQLSVWIFGADRGVVRKVAVVQQKVHVRY